MIRLMKAYWNRKRDRQDEELAAMVQLHQQDMSRIESLTAQVALSRSRIDECATEMTKLMTALQVEKAKNEEMLRDMRRNSGQLIMIREASHYHRSQSLIAKDLIEQALLFLPDAQHGTDESGTASDSPAEKSEHPACCPGDPGPSGPPCCPPGPYECVR